MMTTLAHRHRYLHYFRDGGPSYVMMVDDGDDDDDA